MPSSKVSYRSTVQPRADDRVFLAGRTGSGKTTLAQMLLLPTARLVVIDSKNGLQDWLTVDDSAEARQKIRDGSPVRVRVVQDKPAIELAELAYESGNIIVYVDEINAIIRPGSNPPAAFIDIWQRGRSRQVGGWAATQRPVSIPLFFLSEAEHFFIFSLTVIEDRKRVAGFAGETLLDRPIDPYGFYYYNVRKDHTIYFTRLKLR